MRAALLAPARLGTRVLAAMRLMRTRLHRGAGCRTQYWVQAWVATQRLRLAAQAAAAATGWTTKELHRQRKLLEAQQDALMDKMERDREADEDDDDDEEEDDGAAFSWFMSAPTIGNRHSGIGHQYARMFHRSDNDHSGTYRRLCHACLQGLLRRRATLGPLHTCIRFTALQMRRPCTAHEDCLG